MKKCASCTKDLPEAALHCVFCGAKQPPTPAVQPGLAKTAFGYSNEMMEHLRQVADARNPGPAPAAQSAAPPMPPNPALRHNPPPMPPMPPRTNAPSAPPGYGQPAPATAATLFIDNTVPSRPPRPQPHAAMPAYAQTLAAPPPLQPMPGPRQNPPSHPPPYGAPNNGAPQGMGLYAPQPMGPQPMPFGGPAPGMRGSGLAIGDDHWRDSLKLVMLVWGLLVLAAIATPLTIDPLAFSWDALIHGEGAARVPFLVTSALGVLGVVGALLPMPTIARGLLAALLGLAVVTVPFALGSDLPPWRELLGLASVLVIVPALLVRGTYPSAALPRAIITLCVIAFVIPYLVPDHGDIPLVGMLKGLVDAEGKAKIDFVVRIARLAIVVLSLLAWMPAPATGGGTMFAWLVMLSIGLELSLLDVFVQVVTGDHVVDALTKMPAAFVLWVIPTACLMFVGYGLATVVGKQLE